MDFALRLAVRGDAPRLTALAREAKAHWGYPAAWLEVWRDALTITPDYIETHAVLVASIESEPDSVIGMCALEDHQDHWELAHLWVDPRAHGRGAGSALVRRALTIAARRRSGSVVRVESDPNAAGFYRRLGAREIGSVPAPMEGDPARVLPVFEIE
ncbi:MAG TPA: GNAT family N-acetyltransferase, partial [Gemmatimonadaceae bacterium]|nr:GNAT family N-acetyltransferase [Gemmatimonadaceae bacterium]